MITIDFDRSERLYKWVDPETGQILTAPSGAENKQRLFQTAVAMLDPELWQAATNWITDEPYLERVIWKAVELVAAGAVETFPGNGRVLAMVNSSDEYGRYSVTNHDGYIVCECTHYTEAGAPLDQHGQKTCKHIASHALYQRTQETRF